MDKKYRCPLNEWEHCIEDECMWYFQVQKICAVPKIAQEA